VASETSATRSRDPPRTRDYCTPTLAQLYPITRRTHSSLALLSTCLHHYRCHTANPFPFTTKFPCLSRPNPYGRRQSEDLRIAQDSPKTRWPMPQTHAASKIPSIRPHCTCRAQSLASILFVLDLPLSIPFHLSLLPSYVAAPPTPRHPCGHHRALGYHSVNFPHLRHCLDVR